MPYPLIFQGLLIMHTPHITNVQREKLSSKSVILLYRLRWQIEIVFKAWKSYHGLEQLKGEREERTKGEREEL